MKRWLAIVVLFIASLPIATGNAAEPKKRDVDLTKLPAPAGQPVDFTRDIQPIFEKNCVSCHGAEKHKGGLRLDLKADALAGGDSGKIIVPGKSAGSILVHYVAGLDPDNLMPPKGDRLTDTQIAVLRAWIDAGANWPEPAGSNTAKAAGHWAFKPPVRPTVPKVKNGKWVRNPIDTFVLARLEKEKIKPSPEADRATLIRRLSLDLLGLPPSPKELADFVNDRRVDAYEQLVDRLLSSPHFGEQWGRHWLDLARYADSDGYEKDSPRPYAYLFRDWVIDAINRDLPFDQFTIQQIAGDLLPNATHEQKVATGFQRQTLTNKEGGVDQEEFRCKATVDRVSTTGAVWLGLTVGCAECHSHKYDPISQREFYQFYAFFNDASEKDIPAPQPAERAEYEAAKKKWDETNSSLHQKLDAYLKNEAPEKLAFWEKSAQADAIKWKELTPATVAATSSKLKVQKDGSVLATGKAVETDTYTIEVAAGELNGVTGFRLETLPESTRRPVVGRSKSNNFVLTDFSVKVQAAGETNASAVPLDKAQADFSQDEFSPSAVLTGDKKTTGWAIAPQTNQTHVLVFETAQTLNLEAGAKLIFTLGQQFGLAHTIGRFRLAATTSVRPLRAELVPEAAAQALAIAPEQRTKAQRDAVIQHFAAQVDPEAKKLNDQIAAHAKLAPKAPDTKAAVLLQDARGRVTHVHVRGDFLRPGDEVSPGTFAVLPPLKPRGEKPDRLDLASWLMDPANPLTARVTVNHLWKHLFGRALVASVNDFGTRGEKPSHPELLDWLATEFPRAGWSRKAMIKLIVMSATYRQSSDTRIELTGRDPGNLLLARQNRFRLEAENIRDVYLAAGGLLNPAIGGPSIRPQLPADIAALGYANSVKWQASEGAEQYRRGMYIFFQRTVPYPMLMTFDAPDSNVTCTRRETSDTPLQSLTLLNDPVFFECAQALGRQLAEEPGATDERLRRAFQRCLARDPDKAELARLLQMYADQMRLLKDAPGSAPKIAGAKTGDAASQEEKATLVAVSRVIMNLDEFVTRD